MRKMLVPTEIASQIDLYEAVLWIAFNLYAPAQLFVDEEEMHGEYRIHEPAECLIGDELCKKYNLPKNYAINYIDKNEEVPFESYSLWRFYEENLQCRPQEAVDRNMQAKREYESYIVKQQPFTEALENYLEIHKSKLFISLKNGSVKAFGKKVFDSVSNIPSEALVKEGSKLKEIGSLFYEYNQVFEVPAKHEDIPTKHWFNDAIDWEESSLKRDIIAYAHILVDCESLYEAFPAPKGDIVSVCSINGTNLLDDDTPILKSPYNNIRGRPSFKWHEFTAEMAKRLAKGKLPDMQKSCVIDMQAWCKEKWGVVPSDTNLKNYISPFYQAKNESEIKSES